MPVTINGTTGIAGVDGSNTTPAIKGGTSTGTGVFYGTNTVSLATGGTTAVTVDSSQNVGIGVTPSAWLSTFKTMQVGNGAAISGRTNTASQVYWTSNAYIDSGASWRYLTSDYANRYYTDTGKHIWDITTSGTAGTAISFTQAMTLDSSGNLLVGTTTSPSIAKTVYAAGNVQTSTQNTGFRGSYSTGAVGNGSTTNLATQTGIGAAAGFMLILRETAATGSWAMFAGSTDGAGVALIGSGGPTDTYSATSGTAGKCNVYVSSNNIVLQNNTGGSRTYTVAFIFAF